MKLLSDGIYVDDASYFYLGNVWIINMCVYVRTYTLYVYMRYACGQASTHQATHMSINLKHFIIMLTYWPQEITNCKNRG